MEIRDLGQGFEPAIHTDILLHTQSSHRTLNDTCVQTMSSRMSTPLIRKVVIQILGMGWPAD